MTAKDRLIEALKALCAREGGPTAVADEIGANDQTLKQIIAGTKLPSGRPRGVGPDLQRRLERRYPGWSALAVAVLDEGISPRARFIAEWLDSFGPPDSLEFLRAYMDCEDALRALASSGLTEQIGPLPSAPTLLPGRGIKKPVS
jgi:hypothetical protein